MTLETFEDNFLSSSRRGSICSNRSCESANSAQSRDSGSSGRLLSPGHAIVSRSAPHSRSCSFKNKPRPKELDMLGSSRPRTNSVPINGPFLLSVSCDNIGEEISSENRENGTGTGIRRVRSFKCTSKGVINRGDSFKRKNTNELASAGNTQAEAEENRKVRGESVASQQSSNVSTTSSNNSPTFFRVVMLGASGVGKTALTQQFMTSEYIGAFDTTVEGEVENTVVSVLLDGEESTVDFMDRPAMELPLDSINADAYLVVFAINDRHTYDVAVDIVCHLRNDLGTDRTIIVIANKIDLVRKRKIAADEAKAISELWDCKYVETSAALNHFIDELLVGTVKQIRLKLSVPPSPTKAPKKYKPKKYHTRGPRGLLNKIFRRASSKKAKSCDNLYEL